MGIPTNSEQLVGKSGGLGERLRGWVVSLWHGILTSPFGIVWLFVFDRLSKGVQNVPPDAGQRILEVLSGLPFPSMQTLAFIIAILSGKTPPGLRDDYKEIITSIVKDPRNYFGGIAKALKDNPPVGWFQQQLGGFITEQALFPLTQLMDEGRVDPQKALAMMEGRLGSIVLGVHVFSLIAEIVGLTQIETVATALNQFVRAMGIEEIMHEMMHPILRVGFHEFGRRYYNKRYRPSRWSMGELTQLYAMREITAAELKNGAEEEGYQDADIEKALHLAEQRIGIGDIMKAYDLDLLDVGQTVNYLHRRGYASEDIDFLIKLEDAARKQSDLGQVSSVALDAFKKGLLSEQRFRQIRSAARVPQDRVDLEVELALLSKQTQRKDLTVSNIEAAYKSNVIARQEADKYLQDLDIDGQARSLLLDTWSEEKAPKVLRLNATTIIQAYNLSLFDRQKAVDLLKSVGWSGADAELMLSVADAKAPKEKPLPTEAQVITAYNNELITLQDAIIHLGKIGFDEAAATLSLRNSTLNPATSTRTLTESQIVKLLQIGVFSWDDAIAYMIALNYDPQTAELALVADTTSKPKATPPQKAG